MNKECASEQSHGLMTGPSNNIHKELKFDYVDNFDRHNSCFTNSVSPLQYHTAEKYQVSHSDMSGGYDDKPLLLSSNAKHLGTPPYQSFFSTCLQADFFMVCLTTGEDYKVPC
uniref:Uncharacterized protein n=1 Tax=Lactuca sativa TaxID=4236 RepID=A0A9R1V0A2_LACSA|nr:hypothetical protein LSAT_V11C700353390 [Lactuca sativa]